MKILFLVLLQLSFLLSAAQSGASFVHVKGSLTNSQGVNTIYIDRMVGKPVELAQSPVNEQGKFEFSFEAPTADIYRIRITESNYLLVILEPGDTLTMQADAFQLNSSARIEGSLETAKVYAIGPYVSRFEQHLDSLTKTYQNYLAEKRPETDLELLQREYQAVRDTFISFLRVNIALDPSALAWLFFLEKLEINDHFDMYALVADALGNRYPENVFVKNLVRRVEAERYLAIGSEAPDIRLPSPQGDTLALSDFRGKVVLIDFWAGWCGPCRRENPYVRGLYNQYKHRGFEVFAVSLDRTRESWVDAIAKDSLEWPQVSDLQYWKSSAAKTYQVSAIPYTVLLDRDGKIVAKKLRGEALARKLEELLPEVAGSLD